MGTSPPPVAGYRLDNIMIITHLRTKQVIYLHTLTY